MVQVDLSVGPEELDVLTEISLAKEVNRKSRKKLRIFYGVLAFLCLFLALLYASKGDLIFGMLYAVLLVLCLYMIVWGVGRRHKKIIRKAAEAKYKEGTLSLPRRYVFDADGVKIVSDMGNGSYGWNAFKCWSVVDHYIHLERADDQLVLVDRNKLSQSQWNELEGFLQNVLKEV
jgi:hypothetical protein